MACTFPIPSPKHTSTLPGVQEGVHGLWPAPGTPHDPPERQEAKRWISSTSFLHCIVLLARSMASEAPSSSSFGYSPLEHLLPKLLVIPSGRVFSPLLSFFKISVSFPDLPQSGYDSPQSCFVGTLLQGFLFSVAAKQNASHTCVLW